MSKTILKLMLKELLLFTNFALMKTSNTEAIVLFDGICNLCNGSVQFIIKHDPKEQFSFASLQSDAAKKLLLQFNYDNSELKTIVLLEDGQIYTKSTAVLKICKRLNSMWTLMYVFIIIPRGLRDFVYNLVSKYRYSWFGKKDNCTFYIDGYKNRFI